MSSSHFAKPSNQKGFLLLEYLVALALFGMVLLYADSIFALHLRVKQQIETQSNRITTLRQLSLQLQPVIAQAGYSGCQTRENSMVLHKALQQSWQPALPPALQGKVMSGTDVLVLEQVGSWTVSLQNSMQHPDDVLMLPEVTASGHMLFIIDDCETIEFFSAWVSHWNGTTQLQPLEPLSKAYGKHAVVSPWVTRALYLNPDFALQEKFLAPEQAAATLHENIQAWQLTRRPGLLEVNVALSEEFILWFAY